MVYIYKFESTTTNRSNIKNRWRGYVLHIQSPVSQTTLLFKSQQCKPATMWSRQQSHNQLVTKQLKAAARRLCKSRKIIKQWRTLWGVFWGWIKDSAQKPTPSWLKIMYAAPAAATLAWISIRKMFLQAGWIMHTVCVVSPRLPANLRCLVYTRTYRNVTLFYLVPNIKMTILWRVDLVNNH